MAIFVHRNRNKELRLLCNRRIRVLGADPDEWLIKPLPVRSRIVWWSQMKPRINA